MDRETAAWLDQLPDRLVSQRRLLERLISWCEADDDVRWLAVGCSLERGDADDLSDVDISVGVRQEVLESVLDRLMRALAGFGEVVECFDHDLELPNVKLRHVFVQYGDRTQVDVNVTPAATTYLPRVIVLYDPEGVVNVVGNEALDPKPGEVRLWACEAWLALANAGKYLRRSSFWEAQRELELARERLFRLWALAESIPQARYGITAILDATRPSLPPGIEQSLPGDDTSNSLAAAIYLADQLAAVQERLEQQDDYGVPAAFAHFVRDDLDAIQQ